jgi:NADH-quinone oxidoreductase subunit J
MQLSFYLFGLVAILTVIRAITHVHPVHALLYLITSLLAMAGIFFSLGAYFAGALEIIVYAGAIMVLFVFVVMMLNLGKATQKQEKSWLKLSSCIGPGVISLSLLVMLIYTFLDIDDREMSGGIIDAKAVGIRLFGPYAIIVELASMLLLAGLVVAFHIGSINYRQKKNISEEEKSTN